MLCMCERCGNYFHERKSTATLRQSYCTGMCEGREFGMTIKMWSEVRRKVVPDAERAKRLMREFHTKDVHERAEQWRTFFQAMKDAGAL